MTEPTDHELDVALAAARRLREQGRDEQYLAKVLLAFDHRQPYLLDVLRKASRYLHSGEGAREHAELVRAIEHAEAALAAPASTWDVQPW